MRQPKYHAPRHDWAAETFIRVSGLLCMLSGTMTLTATLFYFIVPDVFSMLLGATAGLFAGAALYQRLRDMQRAELEDELRIKNLLKNTNELKRKD